MYVVEIELSDIRSIVVKLRVDRNCSWDSKNTSFRYKKVKCN